METVLREECRRLGITLSDKQLAQFRVFGTALLEKNQVMNLTAITEPDAVARLHFADSLALLNAADFREKRVLDVGCGAGFPGVPLKLAEPSIDLTLLDSLQKRVNWLREALEAMGVSAHCVAARAEEYPEREQFDIVTSRAVARLNLLCELCIPFVKVGGCFLAMKAAAAEAELEEAAHAISVLGGRLDRSVDYELDGAVRRILVIQKVRPTPPAYPRRFSKIKQSPL
mgnify:CR=1 FL=1